MAERILGPQGSKRRRRFLWVPILVIAFCSLFVITSASAVHDLGLFELDRNATTTTSHDWDQVFNAAKDAKNECTSPTTALGSNALACSFDHDPLNATIFTTGASKDDLDIRNGTPPNTTAGWLWTNGSVPDKDEIDDAGAAMFTNPTGVTGGPAAGDQILYFAADRHANNGSSDFGFWFFKSSVSLNADGTFSGQHTVGDLLILSTFTVGGATTTIRAFQWVGKNGTCPPNTSYATSNNTVCGPIATLGDCTTIPTNGTDFGCGTVNATTTPSPWPYTPKSGPSGSFPSGSFFEGGIDLTKFNLQGCFSAFTAETRSSPSVDATLKDFVIGGFNPCSASISIAPNGTNEVGTNHTFTVTVLKKDASTGFVPGPASGVTVTTTPTDSNSAATTYVPAGQNTCTTGAAGTCSVTITSSHTGITTMKASATVSFQGSGSQDVSTDGTGANSGPATKTWVDANITIGPDDTNGIGENHTFTVTVKKDVGDGAGFVAVSGVKPSVTLTNGGNASYTLVSPGDTCASTGTNSSGQCTVTFTSQTAGTVTGSASVSLTITTATGTSGTITRSTNSTHGSSGNTVKTFVDGTLKWAKVDKSDTTKFLGGASFQVCHTDNIISSTNPDTFAPITPPVCFTVVDNDLSDANSADGKFELDHLALGKYTVKETVAPAGYQLDPSTKNASLTTDNLPASASVDLGNFLDERLFRVIVITCNDSTHTLVASTVTLSGQATSPLDTITSVPTSLAGRTPAITQSDICSIGGASYGGLAAGTYAPSVLLPKP